MNVCLFAVILIGGVGEMPAIFPEVYPNSLINDKQLRSPSEKSIKDAYSRVKAGDEKPFEYKSKKGYNNYDVVFWLDDDNQLFARQFFDGNLKLLGKKNKQLDAVAPIIRKAIETTPRYGRLLRFGFIASQKSDPTLAYDVIKAMPLDDSVELKFMIGKAGFQPVKAVEAKPERNFLGK